MADKIETSKESILLVTDLSQAFDIVSHKILVEKLRVHGMRDSACELMKNFLKNRSYTVNIQSFKSDEIKLRDVSVIQGFTMYNLEVVDLPKVMNDTNCMRE